jgi:nitrous oxidase accessory protein
MRRTVLILSFIIAASQTNAAVTHVYNNLQAALNKANSGDTLYVHKGLYKEHDILVKKKLTIIGKDCPIVDGDNKNQLFVIAADSVWLQGFCVQHTGRSSMTDMAGIRLQNASYITVIGNKLLNNTYGIYLQNCKNCFILNNTIQANSKDELNSGNGIHAWKSEHLSIKNNYVSGHRDGIYFEFVTESQIINNVSTKNVRYGLHFMFSHRDTYDQNKFMDNGSGVAVMYSKGVIMTNNIFYHNWGDAAYAILLKEIEDSKIEHNVFTKNTVGLYLEGTSRIQIMFNTFKENGWAIKVQASCSDNNFERNNFIANSFDVATNGTMMLNTFKQNYWDKYDGYDLNRNKIGDVPYYPVSIYAVLTEHIPTTMILYRSFLTDIMDQVEKVMPSIIPDQLKDDNPMMKKWNLK